MDGDACHALALAEPSEAQKLVRDVLTVKRVGAWTDRDSSAVHHWLRRRPADCPVPPELIPTIFLRARAEGIHFDPVVLWPALRAFL